MCRRAAQLLGRRLVFLQAARSCVDRQLTLLNWTRSISPFLNLHSEYTEREGTILPKVDLIPAQGNQTKQWPIHEPVFEINVPQKGGRQKGKKGDLFLLVGCFSVNLLGFGYVFCLSPFAPPFCGTMTNMACFCEFGLFSLEAQFCKPACESAIYWLPWRASLDLNWLLTCHVCGRAFLTYDILLG